MSDEILNSLLKEYSQKKLQAELNLEKRKQELYDNVPRLKQIEDDLNKFAIFTAKSILQSGNDSLKHELQEKVLENKVSESETIAWQRE